MSLMSLFFREYNVRPLEIKGDVSGFPTHFRRIVEYTEPDAKDDLAEPLQDDELRARHRLIMTQARYAISK